MKLIPGVRFALTKAVPPRRGFALVITLTLMILLTILAVGLLSLSTISLRSSGTEQAMNIARANARMALVIAVGQLQKATGPDQRITATADIAGDTGGVRLAADGIPKNIRSVTNVVNKMSSVRAGTRHWLGIWQNNLLTANTLTPNAQQMFNTTPSPKFVSWLISGNELASDPTSPPFTPASASASVDSDGVVADPKTAVILAGRKTVGKASPGTIDDYVAAPLVDISKGGSEQLTGRYGWWIGDEGVKAKINRTTPYAANARATYHYLSAQRSGWESVTGFSKYPLPGKSLAGVVTLPQVKLLHPDFGKSDEIGRSPAERAFHAATTDSYGVIADTYQGGLRVDLTSTLSKDLVPAPSASSNPYPNMAGKNKNVIPQAVGGLVGQLRGPKWDRIKEFHDVPKTITDGVLNVKAGASATDSYPIAPVILDLRMLMGVKLINSGAADTYRMNACGKFAVSLANPYPYTLSWSQPLDLELLNVSPSTEFPSRVYTGESTRHDDKAFIGRSGEASVFGQLTFKIPAGTIPPGGAVAYTLNSRLQRPRAPFSAASVTLSPLSSDADNFNTAVIELLGDDSKTFNISTSLQMDVREGAETSQVTVQLKLGASVLRSLERFEFDNGAFESNRRTVTRAQATQVNNKPFGLQCYNFQISQPGGAYGDLLPAPVSGATTSLGLSNSTLRTFADFNLQGARFHKPISSYNPTPYTMWNPTALSELPVVPGGITGRAFTRDLTSTPLKWGRMLGGSSGTVLFSFPETIASLAQFQHADLTADATGVSLGHQPGNAVGNSYAPIFLSRNLISQARTDYQFQNKNSAISIQRNYYDISHLLNTALWDTYYFSTIPNQGSAPLNRSITLINKEGNQNDLTDPSKAAGQLLIDGAFNVNSTSVDAWKALLSSSKHLRHPADQAGSSSDAMFPRSLEQTSGSSSPATGDDADSFTGYRRLSDTELGALATEITKQVRLRGPFVSVSHFVNRALVSLNTNAELSRSGAIQSAIDASGINIDITGTKLGFSSVEVAEDRMNLQNNGTGLRADLDGTDPSNLGPDWASNSLDLNPGTVASIAADRQIVTSPNFRKEQGYRSTGIPGWLTQADVFQVIGPSIASRSDTFRVRAYGEAVDPKTGVTTAKAWCEAIIQRMPDYVDTANTAVERPAQLNPTNRTYGRKYEIISFSWLHPDDI